MSDSDCNRAGVSGHAVSLAACLASLLLCTLGFAADAPDAGQVLQGIRPALSPLRGNPSAALPEEPVRPAMSADAGLRVGVKGFQISGARAFPVAELRALLADAVGKELGFADLQMLARRVTRYYRERGFVFARAYLPAQDIHDGVVEIAVLEGRLGKISLENKSPIADSTVNRTLSGVREGEVLKDTDLERRLLLLDELPGVEVRSTLKPGASVGTTDLDVQVLGTQRVTGTLELDNYGSRFAGAGRLGAAVNFNSPFGLGDSLSLRLLGASGTDYGRFAYQLPVGSLGTKLGIAGSSLHYRLGKTFEALHSHGTADIGTLYVLQPLMRGRDNHVDLQVSYDVKRLEDSVDSTGVDKSKHLGVLSVGFSGDHTDNLAGGGLWNWSATYVGGSLHLDSVTQASDAAGLRTEGGYAKAAVEIARLQRLADRLDVYVQASGQVATGNLDSSEKMSLGGVYGVRAYPQDEADSDEAVLVNIELRYALAPAWQLTGFFDDAKGWVSHSPLMGATGNGRLLSGFGFGINWSHKANLSVRAFAAWRTGGAPTSDADRLPRVWVQLVQGF